MKKKYEKKKNLVQGLIWATAQLYCDRKIVLQPWVCSWMGCIGKGKKKLYCDLVL